MADLNGTVREREKVVKKAVYYVFQGLIFPRCNRVLDRPVEVKDRV